MTKLIRSKRVTCSVYVKSLKFTERNFSKDFTLQKQALADVCKIDVLEDFAKFTGKHLRKCFPVNFVEHLPYRNFQGNYL